MKIRVILKYIYLGSLLPILNPPAFAVGVPNMNLAIKKTVPLTQLPQNKKVFTSAPISLNLTKNLETCPKINKHKESDFNYDAKLLKKMIEDKEFRAISFLASDYRDRGNIEEKDLCKKLQYYQTAIKLYYYADNLENDNDALLAFDVELKMVALQAESKEALAKLLRANTMREKIKILDENNFGSASRRIGESYLHGWDFFPKDHVQAQIHLKTAKNKCNSDASCYLRECWNKEGHFIGPIFN